jgi:hypothetical protein
VDITIVITRIYDHPVTTTEHGCEYHGSAFAREILWRNARLAG